MAIDFGPMDHARRDVHVRLAASTHGAVRSFARRSGLALNTAVGVLVERGLALEEANPTGDSLDARTLSTTSLAILVAVEQTQKLLALIVPDGKYKCEALYDEAHLAARQRLLRLEGALRDESSC